MLRKNLFGLMCSFATVSARAPEDVAVCAMSAWHREQSSSREHRFINPVACDTSSNPSTQQQPSLPSKSPILRHKRAK